MGVLLYLENLAALLVVFARSDNNHSMRLLYSISTSMDSCFLIAVFVFAFSLSNGERTLKFVTVVSIILPETSVC